MLSGIKIQNFKGIKRGKVGGLRNVNLFIGKNDSGKSTIMEAAYYTLKEYTSASLPEITSRKADVTTGGCELWFKYETRQPIRLTVSYKDIQLNLIVESNPPQITTLLEGVGNRKHPTTGKVSKWSLGGNSYIGADFSYAARYGSRFSQLPQITDKVKQQLNRSSRTWYG